MYIHIYRYIYIYIILLLKRVWDKGGLKIIKIKKGVSKALKLLMLNKHYMSFSSYFVKLCAKDRYNTNYKYRYIIIQWRLSNT